MGAARQVVAADSASLKLLWVMKLFVQENWSFPVAPFTGHDEIQIASTIPPALCPPLQSCHRRPKSSSWPQPRSLSPNRSLTCPSLTYRESDLHEYSRALPVQTRPRSHRVRLQVERSGHKADGENGVQTRPSSFDKSRVDRWRKLSDTTPTGRTSMHTLISGLIKLCTR